MGIFKKTVTLRLPVWGILAAILILALLVGAVAMHRPNREENRLLKTLDTQDVTAAYIIGYFLRAPDEKKLLSQEDTAALVSLLNQVKLTDEPYDLKLLGGHSAQYEFTLSNGKTFRFGCVDVPTEYFYWLDGKYYLCSELSDVNAIWRQLNTLYETQCQEYFPEK